MLHTSRRLLPLITRFVLAVLVFAQLALAAEACTLPGSVSAMQYQSSAEMPGCDKMSSTACVIHLTQDNNNSDFSFPLVIPALGFLSLFYLVPVISGTTPPQNYPSVISRYASDPPLSVRFCSFQI